MDGNSYFYAVSDACELHSFETDSRFSSDWQIGACFVRMRTSIATGRYTKMVVRWRTCRALGVPSWGLRCTECKIGALEQKEKRLSASLAHHQFSLNNLRALLTKLDKEDAEAGVVSDEDK